MLINLAVIANQGQQVSILHDENFNVAIQYLNIDASLLFQERDCWVQCANLLGTMEERMENKLDARGPERPDEN
jgi:hypothetical protein